MAVNVGTGVRNIPLVPCLPDILFNHNLSVLGRRLECGSWLAAAVGSEPTDIICD